MSLRTKLISAGVTLAVQATLRGKLPFCLCRKALSRPLCIGVRIIPGDLDHRMVLTALEIAPGSLSGCSQSAPLTQRHHAFILRKSTGPLEGVKTSDPG